MSFVRAVAMIRPRHIAFAATVVLLCPSIAVAADRGKPASAEKTYQADRAACMAGQTHQARPTCLQEAGAALQEARRGSSDGAADYEKNRLLRCEHHPQGDRELCIRRMNGEGTVSGSVGGGGIVRELVVTVPAIN